MTRMPHDRRLIGEILLERGLITAAQLEESLSLQKTGGAGVYLGEVLIRLGYVSEIDIVTALVVQFNLPYISLTKHEVSGDIVRLIPADLARRERLVPFERAGNVLSVVVADPLDDQMRREVEACTGCCVAVFISTRSEIDQALERLYPLSRETA